MHTMTCPRKDQYREGGKCCNRCPPGKYVSVKCNDTTETTCDTCEEGYFTAALNHIGHCYRCNECSLAKQRKSKNCTTTEDTECACVPGFYCSNTQCDHCQQVTSCPEGEGVKIQANRTSDVICTPCEEGTYSNVTDFSSPCKAHTRCEDLGKVLDIPGTKTANAVCGGDIPHTHTGCSWMLPAGLWSGLVLTALILFAFVICKRARRRSYRAASSNVPVTLVEMVPAEKLPLPDLSLPSAEHNGHCQESCPVGDCKLPLFTPDDSSMDCSLPITPFKASVSFVESTLTNGSAGCRSGNFFRTYSEPQEDEWCGT